MRQGLVAAGVVAMIVAAAGAQPEDEGVRFMILDPGHFHAALVLKEMYPTVSPRVDVYAPLGPDLLDHLKRVARFNAREERPTAWNIDVHCGVDALERLCRERPGNVVILSGRNRDKIRRIKAALEAGLSVLADKPWIIRHEDFPLLEEVLTGASARRLIAFDIMTERYEATSAIQRALVADTGIIGALERGSPERPGVEMESVHHILKMVAGAANPRPTWFFDTDEQGEGLTDVATHLVDLVQWTLVPDQALDYRQDVRVLSASRWPTELSRAQLREVTGESALPGDLGARLVGDSLPYVCNGRMLYTLRGIHVRVSVLWDWQAPAGQGDSLYAVFRGTRAAVEVRQGAREQGRPEVYVVPARAADLDAVKRAVRARIDSLQAEWPGLSLADTDGRIHVVVPDRYRVGHEAHFAQVTGRFLSYLADPASLPRWEGPGLLAKYFVTTKGAELSRAAKMEVSPRLAP
jgi:predicted dehydrogenase